MKVVESRELTKAYGRVKALKGLSFSLEEHKITGLVGRNGAGKTTLLKIMAGYLKATEGEVRVFSSNPFNNLTVSANTIFVDDQMAFPKSLNLAEILESAGSFYENWNMELAEGLFDYFSLNPKQLHQNLSKGMRSTFNVIIGISARCPLTIFDEPTAGMDVGARKDFYRALLRDYLQHPRTVILSSHLINEIEHVLEDVLLIREGEKRLHLPVADLKDYAVGLRGNKAMVEELTAHKEIFHKEKVGKDNAYVVIKNDPGAPILQQARRAGVEVLPVATDDICIYLTVRKKGGIDDVFDSN